MKTFIDCEEFEMDLERSTKLEGPLKISPNLIDGVDFADLASRSKDEFSDLGYTIDRWNS